MKRTNRLLAVLLAFGFSGCVNLEYNEDVVRDEEWVYNSPFNGIKNLVYDVYGQAFSEFKDNWGLTVYNGYNGALRASATDESDFANSISNIHKYYNGGWTPANPFPETWEVAYRAIAEIHYFLENVSRMSLEEYRYDSNYSNMVLQFELFPYELRFLRAYFYFELVKTYGDVPLVTTTLTNSEANNVERAPVQKVLKFIVDECDAIAEYLPYTYLTEPWQETGRATRPAALALKTRALLYAASPLFNTNNDKELWKQAAAAAKVVIDKAPGWGIRLSAYNQLWGHDAFNNAEIIWGIGQWESNTFETNNYPVGVEGGSSGNCPTQSLVDSYEFANDGKSFKERYPQSQINVTQEHPYEGLDPRFALTVVKNGDRWPTNSIQQLEIQSYQNGFNGAPKYNATTTGYYLRKYVDGNCVTTYNNPTVRRHTWIYMRLAEVYLNYAEAMYRYYGDADAKGDFGMSANEAVNVLRNRSDINMPEFSGSANFEERYMRERMVELAFEDHRFWDVRRWKKGNEFFANITVANQQLENGDVILRREVKNRQWNDKYYLYPIPQSELQKNSKMTQNPGW
ncbi:MAG: RagB/SusD family nutrient uptake outer membrane protein [Tannerella sp.]|jgi:hypothetical protein|nr:RagB/SusD family nutrient uptake outer membrane protein [Tannerella sp.]